MNIPVNRSDIKDDSLRLMFEEQERDTLSSRACLSSQSRGRIRDEHACYIRTCFQRDIDRITHSESFRRLKHKTQVFLAPINDHYRTRLTHTLEVVCTARCIARCLRLNEDLVEAIALGHDLGHTPFGHAGEEVLNEFCESGFHHASHGVRVVTELEKYGKGLNLTLEVIDGIANHSKGRKGPAMLPKDSLPLTLEAQIVRIADLVAYINHDIDDAIRAGIIKNTDLPERPRELLGSRHSKRIHAMVKDIVNASYDSDLIRMSDPVLEATEELKAFLYEKVYSSPEIEMEVEKSRVILRRIIEWFRSHPEELHERLAHDPPADQSATRTLVDYIAGMTDRFAINTYTALFGSDIDLVSSTNPTVRTRLHYSSQPENMSR